MLRVFGFVRTRRWLELISATPAPGQVSPDELLAAQRLAWLVGIAGRRGPIRTTCLPQALLIYYQLRRRTLAPQLILGVRMRDGAFDAHAWTELQTVPLGQFGLEHSAFERRE